MKQISLKIEHVVATIVVICVIVVTYFAALYLHAQKEKAVFEKLDLEQKLLTEQAEKHKDAQYAPTINPEIFVCDVPSALLAGASTNASYSFSSSDVLGTKKAIFAILKKYPEAKNVVDAFNTESTNTVGYNDYAFASINGELPNAVAKNILSEIEKIQGVNVVLETKNVYSQPANELITQCTSMAREVQGLAFKERALLDLLKKDTVNVYDITTITNELTNVRNQHSGYQHSITNVPQALQHTKINISINLLKG